MTLAGDDFDWMSAETALFVGGALLAIVAFLVTEMRAKEPIVPLRLFRDRTTTLAIIASVAIGVAMFGSSVFLGQYLQISRGYSPTAAGLLTIPMVGGLLLSSTVCGIPSPAPAGGRRSWSRGRSSSSSASGCSRRSTTRRTWCCSASSSSSSASASA